MCLQCLIERNKCPLPCSYLALVLFPFLVPQETWDYSAWVRVYSVYLDERLDVFRVMHFDPSQVCKRDGTAIQV